MERHRTRPEVPLRPRTDAPQPVSNGAGRQPPDKPPEDGDILYGARACGKWLFDDDSDAACKRIFHIWSVVRGTKRNPGFFKLGATICLSKAAFRAFIARFGMFFVPDRE